jgi:hypothetical protein
MMIDPKTQRFTPAGTLSVARLAHTATLLHDGRVLFASGHSAHGDVLASAELYDPASGKASAAGPMRVRRYKHAGLGHAAAPAPAEARWAHGSAYEGSPATTLARRPCTSKRSRHSSKGKLRAPTRQRGKAAPASASGPRNSIRGAGPGVNA